MTIKIAADIERMISVKVAAGRYNNSDDVLPEVLHALDRREPLQDLRESLALDEDDVDRGDYVE